MPSQVPLEPHDGWQDSVEEWDLWYLLVSDNDPSARERLILMNGPNTDHFKALRKRLSYADQGAHDEDDLDQHTYELIIALVDEFDPTRAESFKAFVLDRGLKRAVDMARRGSEIPRRVRESTAIFNEAKERMRDEMGAEADMLMRGRDGMQRILDYAVANDMWNAWLHPEPTADWIEKNIEIRDTFIRQASLEALSTGADGETREVATEHAPSAEHHALETEINLILKGIIDKVLGGLDKDHLQVLSSYAEGMADGGEREAVKRVHQFLIKKAKREKGCESVRVTWSQVANRIRLALVRCPHPFPYVPVRPRPPRKRRRAPRDD